MTATMRSPVARVWQGRRGIPSEELAHPQFAHVVARCLVCKTLGSRSWHPSYKLPESDARLLAEILIVLPPSALAFADVCVSLDELDGANVLDHRETELCLHAQAERRSVIDRERLTIHFVGKNGLRIFRQLQANRALEVPRSLGVWLRRGFVVERALARQGELR